MSTTGPHAVVHRAALPLRLAFAAASLAVFLGACGTTRHAPEHAGDTGPDELATRVDARIADLVAARQFSGAVVLVRDGSIVYRRGYGYANHAAGIAFTPTTPSDGASIAKTFTAAGIALLVAEGRVDLDAPVRRHVPNYPHAATTVRDLLAHSTGLPDDYAYFDPHFDADAVRTTPAMLDVVARTEPTPRFAPGTRYEYSNLGYDAAAEVIARVAGVPVQDYFAARFFAPLAMRDTWARPARFADWPGTRTLGYRWRDGAWQVFDVYDKEGFIGASNLYASADDLARWADAHARGTALPADVIAAGLERPRIDGKPSAINRLSWYCDAGDTRCYYTGSLNAFHAFVYWDRVRRESVAFVSNSSLPPWATVTLQRDLVALLAGMPPGAPEPGPTLSVPRKRLGVLVGRYRGADGGTVDLTLHDERLQLRADCGLDQAVFVIADTVLYVPGLDWFIGFDGALESPGLVVRSQFHDARLVRVGDASAIDCARR